MAFNIKDFVSGLAVKIKSTADGSNGEVTHHHVDSSALPAGAATAAKQDTGNASLAAIDSKLGGTINVAVVSGGGGGGDASAANQVAGNTLLGAVTETAPTSDTASSGLNGRLQRIAQRLTAMIAALGTPLQAGGAVSVSNFPGTQAVSGPLTDAQLRASAVPVSGPLTDAQIRATALPVAVSGVATAAKQDTLAGLVGEVQTTPTANTVLDRLKTIATALAGVLGVTPQMASGGNISTQTNNPGSTYSAFASQACKQVTVVNDSGTTILVQQGGGGVGIPIFDQSAFTFFGIANANALGVKRKDEGNAQVTVAARWEA